MFKGIIINDTTGNKWVGRFETSAEVDSWLAENTKHPSRVISDTWLNEKHLSQKDMDNSLDSRLNNSDMEYLMAKNCSYVINDTTTEDLADKKEKKFLNIISSVDELIVKKAIKDGLTAAQFKDALKAFYLNIF